MRSNRVAKVLISLELLEELLLPRTGRINAIYCDNSKLYMSPIVELLVEDPSFDELQDGCRIPEKILLHKRIDERSLREYK